MEVSVKSIALTIVSVTAVTLAWRILNWIWLRPKKLERYLRHQGFKGRPYRLLYGDLKETSFMTKQAKSRTIDLSDDIAPRVSSFLHQMVKEYGMLIPVFFYSSLSFKESAVPRCKNSFIWMGPIPRVTIANPDHIKEIFTRISDFYKPQADPLSKLLATALTNFEGEKWAKRRSILNPAFHLEKLKLMIPAFHQVCTFGSKYEEGSRIFQLQTELVDLTMKVELSNFIPGWRLLSSKRNKRLKEIDKEIRAVLIDIIKNREKAMKAGESITKDLLSTLMESNFRGIEEHGKNKDVGLTIYDVIEECKQFYFAGHETSSVLLVWTMVLLSKHHNWQARAREEVLQVFGDKKPNYGELNHLKVVSMIIYEVLRLYPPTFALSRAVPKETKLGNLSLPAGVEIPLPIFLVHQDEEIWDDDANEFNLERFSEGIAKQK
ncbi:hypothetical protein Pint_25056 [Pistacia integerrima]|uniref:Uncharacterized protein n=1 Tax=Pistacia integerrima TaxID=434235 RepID=A0ACC0YHX9_9ROSI|nr:hypothetical protein Pint_25056 [Pistacia integerrima]